MIKKFKLTAIIAMALISLGELGWCSLTNYAAGKTGGAELNLALGARPAALGGAFQAQADDLHATLWNPAGLSHLQNCQIGFMHNLYIQATSLEYLAYAQPLYPGAGLGAQVAYLNYGSIDKVILANGWPEASGTFTPSTITLALAYGQALEESLSLGSALTYIRQSLDDQAYSAVALDVGCLLKPGLDHLQLGFLVSHLGSKIAGADLPLKFDAGAAYAVPVELIKNDKWQINVNISIPYVDTNNITASMGTEYCFNESLALRAGYQLKNTHELGAAAGLAVGAGINFTVFTLDYALLSFGDLGLSHQMEIIVRF